LKSDGELALREREGVTEMEPSVHVRIGKRDHVLFIGQASVAGRCVLLKDVLVLPSRIGCASNYNSSLIRTKRLFRNITFSRGISKKLSK
jgi:hypothetical protein